jgi:hypothetical protein
MQPASQTIPARRDTASLPPDRAARTTPFEQRVFLEVTLLSDGHGKPDTARAHLGRLLHSPLGVYIVGTSIAGEDIVVRFDIAASDVDFTLHTLIGVLPDAMIGRLHSRQA